MCSYLVLEIVFLLVLLDLFLHELRQCPQVPFLLVPLGCDVDLGAGQPPAENDRDETRGAGGGKYLGNDGP